MNVPSEISNTLYPCFMRYFVAATCKCVLPRPKLLCSRFACARLDGSNCLIRSSPNVAIKPKLFCFVPLISSKLRKYFTIVPYNNFCFLSLVGTNQISLVQTLLESLHSATFVRSLHFTRTILLHRYPHSKFIHFLVKQDFRILACCALIRV